MFCTRAFVFAITLSGFTLCLGAPIRSSADTVIVYEVPVIRFRTTLGSSNPAERAALAAKRMANSTGNVRYEGKKKEARLYRGDTVIATITSAEAKAQNSTPAGLASIWASRTKAALALPPLKVSEASFKLPIGETRSVRIVGSAAWEAKVENSDPTTVAALKTAEGFDIKTQRAGRVVLSVTGGGQKQTVTVDVLPFAADFPQLLTANVSGFPATPDTVRGSVESAVRNHLKIQDNGKFNFNILETSGLEAGATRTFEVKVSATAPNAFPKSGMVQVQVKNTPLAKRGEDDLWYCNDPENVRQPGPLFSSPLQVDRSVRMLYHHVNTASQPLFLRIQVINSSDKPARFFLLPGDSKPDRDPVQAGLMAGDQFLSQWLSASGEIITIPPGSTLPISLRRMATGETVSGLCSMQLLAGGPDSLLVRADAIPPFPTDDRWDQALISATPWRIVGTPKIGPFDTTRTTPSSHIYPNPYKDEEVSYSVGGRYGFVRIGQRPIARQDQTSALDGNFGVIYNIKANVDNPTSTAMDVEVVFEASAGYAGGLFLINGSYSKTHPLPPKGEKQIARFRLEPGQNKKLTITTVPLSGSSYPITLTIRPVQDKSIFGATPLGRE